MKHLVIAIVLLSSSPITFGQDNIYGVFSNEAGGFKITTLMIHEGGYAYYHAAVAGLIENGHMTSRHLS